MPNIIIKGIKWFHFQDIMLNTENYIKSPSYHLQLLLKVFLMFKKSIWCDETIIKKIVPNAVGISCINCGKTIGCLLDNENI